MYSNIFNVNNARIEQLGKYANFAVITEDVSGQVIQPVNPGYSFQLDANRAYIISKITFTLDVFTNNATPPTQFAYPKYEQFSLVTYLAAWLARSATAIQSDKQQFKNLLFSTTDGISFVYELQEPFIIRTDDVGALFLNCTMSDAGSTIVSLGSFTLPPVAPASVLMYGTLIFEGVSMTLDDFDKQKNKLYGKIF